MPKKKLDNIIVYHPSVRIADGKLVDIPKAKPVVVVEYAAFRPGKTDHVIICTAGHMCKKGTAGMFSMINWSGKSVFTCRKHAKGKK